jgi:hypothetical protein
MLSRKERARARARERLQNETPTPLDESSLRQAEAEVAKILREAKEHSSGFDKVVDSFLR